MREALIALGNYYGHGIVSSSLFIGTLDSLDRYQRTTYFVPVLLSAPKECGWSVYVRFSNPQKNVLHNYDGVIAMRQWCVSTAVRDFQEESLSS